MSKKIAKYTNGFKAEAIKLIDEHQGNVSSVARSIGVRMQTLANWNKKFKSGQLIGTENYDEHLVTALNEIQRLKKYIKTAQMEREILNRKGKLKA